MQPLLTRVLAATAIVLVTVLGAHPVAAHEGRNLIAGKYQFNVGWGDEPTYTGFVNRVALRVLDAAGRPVADVTTLKVQVKSGDETADFSLEPVSGAPGEYHAPLVPTRPGTYSFRFTGAIRGDAIDETFTSGDTTFDSPRDATGIAFPAKDPSAGQLAQRLDRESSRVRSLQATAADAEDKAATATTLAIAGVVVGALGLILGVAGVTRRR